MKRIIKLYSLLLVITGGLSIHIKAQAPLWGIAAGGGPEGSFVIFNVNTDGSGFEQADTFKYSSAGASPQYTQLLELPNGKLYGMTNYGGGNGNGVMFSFAPSECVTNEEEIKVLFNAI